MANIVAFKNEYAADISAVISRALRDVNIRDYPEDQILKLCDRFSAENITKDANWRQIFVAILNGVIVGTASIVKKPVEKTNSHLVLGLFVDPRHQKKGIGSQLLNTVEKQAKEWRVDLLMVPSNISAKDFYLKMGYEYRDGIKKLNAKRHFVLQKKMDRLPNIANQS
jgi:GNAT superfamily N-acetyltransferase